MEFCRLADLVLSGRIDLAYWAEFASAWLLDTCDEGNNWCNGADLNFDTEVNAEDLTNFAVCWLTSDEEAPFPRLRERDHSSLAMPIFSFCISVGTPLRGVRGRLGQPSLPQTGH